jgi:polyhydroxyalkanoate synthesis regulator phasin
MAPDSDGLAGALKAMKAMMAMKAMTAAILLLPNGAVVDALVTACEMKKSECSKVFDALADVGSAQVKIAGKFVILGLFMIAAFLSSPKGAIVDALVTACELKKSECSKVLDALTDVGSAQVKIAGKFVILDLVMIAAVFSLPKGAIVDALVTACEMKKSECSKVLDALAEVGSAQVKIAGKFVILGLVMIAGVFSLPKGAIVDALVTACEMKKSECSKVLDALADVGFAQVKIAGKLVSPGLVMIKTWEKHIASNMGTVTCSAEQQFMKDNAKEHNRSECVNTPFMLDNAKAYKRGVRVDAP